MALGTRDDSGYGFGMAVRGTLLPVLGEVDTHHLLRFDLICSALTSVYFTWFVGSYEGTTLAEVNEAMAAVITGRHEWRRNGSCPRSSLLLCRQVL